MSCRVSHWKRLHCGVAADVTNLASKLPTVGRSTFRRRSASPAIGTQLSGNAVRLEAIYNVEAYVPPAVSFVQGEEPGEIFGSNVFTKAEMQARLPKAVFKSIVATIEKGTKLDPTVADSVAVAMKDWALEK